MEREEAKRCWLREDVRRCCPGSFHRVATHGVSGGRCRVVSSRCAPPHLPNRFPPLCRAGSRNYYQMQSGILRSLLGLVFAIPRLPRTDFLHMESQRGRAVESDFIPCLARAANALAHELDLVLSYRERSWAVIAPPQRLSSSAHPSPPLSTSTVRQSGRARGFGGDARAEASEAAVAYLVSGFQVGCASWPYQGRTRMVVLFNWTVSALRRHVDALAAGTVSRCVMKRARNQCWLQR